MSMEEDQDRRTSLRSMVAGMSVMLLAVELAYAVSGLGPGPVEIAGGAAMAAFSADEPASEPDEWEEQALAEAQLAEFVGPPETAVEERGEIATDMPMWAFLPTAAALLLGILVVSLQSRHARETKRLRERVDGLSYGASRTSSDVASAMTMVRDLATRPSASSGRLSARDERRLRRLEEERDTQYANLLKKAAADTRPIVSETVKEMIQRPWVTEKVAEKSRRWIIEGLKNDGFSVDRLDRMSASLDRVVAKQDAIKRALTEGRPPEIGPVIGGSVVGAESPSWSSTWTKEPIARG